MNEISIDSFKGIAPKFGKNLPAGFAEEAINCKLYDSKLAPLAKNTQVQADANHYNSFAYHCAAWQRGNDRFYCPWKINVLDLLLYKDDSNYLKKKVAWIITKTDISFDLASSEIRSANGDFNPDSLIEGGTFIISGSASNNGAKTVSSTATTTGVITIDEAVADEVAGASVTITVCKEDYLGQTRQDAITSIDLCNAIFEKNISGTTTGAITSWSEKAPQPGAETQITGMTVFEGELYAGTHGNGHLYKWNNVDDWTAVVAGAGANGPLCVFNGKLYCGHSSRGELYEYDGAAATVMVGQHGGVGDSVHDLLVHNGKLWGTITGANEYFVEWNGVDDWIERDINPAGLTLIRGMVIFNNTIHVLDHGGKLFRWNGAALVEVAPQYGATTLESICIHNGEIYAGAFDNGTLLHYNGTDAWEEVAPLLVGSRIYSLISYAGGLYGGTNNGHLYKWNETDAWVQVAAPLGGQIIHRMCIFNSLLYAGTSGAGKLYVAATELTNPITWTASGADPGAYYAVDEDSIVTPLFACFDPDHITINIDGAAATQGTMGSLAEGEWGYGDIDGIGFNTIYVKITGSTDPDDEESDYIQFATSEVDLVRNNANWADMRYQWTLSGSGTNEYYVRAYDGAVQSNPILTTPSAMSGFSIPNGEGTIGSLAVGEWALGDNDSLGYDTIYVRTVDEVDPDTKSSGAIIYRYDIIGQGLIGEIQYLWTLTRNVGGHIDESGPSAVSAAVTATGNQLAKITRPAWVGLGADTYVTHWNLYRLSNMTGTWMFIATIAYDTMNYIDGAADEGLGSTPPGYYTSDQENEIIWDIPPKNLDGITTEPTYGLIFGWKGATLYWPEPGYPDAWVAFYNMNFGATIKNCIFHGQALAVLTATGPYRVDGNNPEALQQSPKCGPDPATSVLGCCDTERGVLYLSDGGIALFDMTAPRIITDVGFGEDWFKANVSPVGAVIIEVDDIVYLFHSAGGLILDFRSDPPIATTLSEVIYGAYRKEDDDALYVMDAAGIDQFGTAAGTKAMTWQSGELLGDHVEEKNFVETEIAGSAVEVNITNYVDGTLSSTALLSMDTTRDRKLGFLDEKSVGRAAQVKIYKAVHATLTPPELEITEAIVRYTR